MGFVAEAPNLNKELGADATLGRAEEVVELFDDAGVVEAEKLKEPENKDALLTGLLNQSVEVETA